MALGARKADREGKFSGYEPRCAIIDIGSNTIRMVVYGGNERAPTVLLNEKVAARLGRDIASTGKLADEAVQIALRSLSRFARVLQDLGVTDIRAVATAAVRDASNGPKFLAKLAKLGLSPEVLSGEEEARISAMGILGAFPGAKGVVADLGGGSLELVRIGKNGAGRATTLPLGTLRLAELRARDADGFRKALRKALKKAGWSSQTKGSLYLVGGTLRAMAVHAMYVQKHPLTDPHGFEVDRKGAEKMTRRIVRSSPEKLNKVPRISSLRSASLPDAAVLLQVMLKALQPERIVFSSWGVREGLLFDGLPEYAREQDPLLAGVADFAAQRGAPPALATRIAGWTVKAATQGGASPERLRLAATSLSLASMQIEPNLRIGVGVDWALRKRWIGISESGRAMLAAAICGNGNQCDLPDEVCSLASKEQLEEAIRWGLAVRLARRIGARSSASLQSSSLLVRNRSLVLQLADTHAALFGPGNEKDLGLLADRMGLHGELEIVEAAPDGLTGLEHSAA